jgi:aspartyl-tRNA(Asn)/glutamyl-tRNA(Gln) amidotransferase subunit A
LDQRAEDEICRMEALALMARMRSRELSPVEVVRAFARRTEALEPVLHSFSHLTLDAALARAAEVESALAAGRECGVLAGLPIGVKDLLHVKGVPTSFGSVAFKDVVAPCDDPVVERLHAAGAISLGKTNTPEFGFSSVGHNPAFPTTTNPWNPELTPGGSSSGAGSAVAAGQCPVALGTDRAGSIRIPAAHCGIFGFKPSVGRVPVDVRADAMSQIGPMTRTVADAALLMTAIAGFDARDRLSLPDTGIDWLAEVDRDVRRLRVGYSRDFGYAPVDPQVVEIVDRAVQVFERDLNCTVEPFVPDWDDPWDDFIALCTFGLDLAQVRGLVERHGSRISPHVVDTVRRRWTAEDYTNAEATRRKVWQRMCALTETFDILVTPTVAVPPFPLLMQGPEQIAGRSVRPMEWIPFTFPVNMCGMPAASVPAGWTVRNLPVGMQIIGPRLGDALVLSASAAFERAAPWKHRWPDLADRAAAAAPAGAASP